MAEDAIKKVSGMGKEVIKTLDPTKEGLTDLDKILKSMIPTAGASALVSGFNDSLKLVIEMDQTFAKLAQKMGVGEQMSSLMKENLAKTAEEVILMGGKFEDAVKIQEDYLNVTNRAALLNADIAKSLYATSKVTGQAADALVTGFLDAGYEADNIAENMLRVQKTANSMGISSQAVSAMVLSNLDKLNKFTFKDGVDGLSKMAAKAAMFRIDMSETFSLADKLLSPENAIEVASALQRLGGATSQLANPLRLMDLAQNNVPELQNQLGKLVEKYTFFNEQTKSFQIMPGARRELKAVSDSLGVSVETLTKMGIEGVKLKKKMSEISFDGLDFNKEQREQIANLANLKDGKYQIEFKDAAGNTVTKTLNDLKNLTEEDKKAFNEFLTKQTEEVGKDPQMQMIDLAKEQLGRADTMIAKLSALQMAPQLAIAGGKGGEDLLQKSFEINQKQLDSFLSANKFDSLSKSITPVTDSLIKISESISDGEFEKAAEEFKNLPGEFGKVIGTQIATPLMGTFMGLLPDNLKNTVTESIEDFFGKGGETEDFIWRPGNKIEKFRQDDLIIGGTNLVNQKVDKPVITEPENKNIIQNNNATVTNKTESTVGGEITLKVVVDSSSSKNITISEASIIGERVAAALKSRPDLQDEFKKALNFTSK
jgi:hypothetical protein